MVTFTLILFLIDSDRFWNYRPIKWCFSLRRLYVSYKLFKCAVSLLRNKILNNPTNVFMYKNKEHLWIYVHKYFIIPLSCAMRRFRLQEILINKDFCTVSPFTIRLRWQIDYFWQWKAHIVLVIGLPWFSSKAPQQKPTSRNWRAMCGPHDTSITANVYCKELNPMTEGSSTMSSQFRLTLLLLQNRCCPS